MEILRDNILRELKKRMPWVDKFDGTRDAAVLIPFICGNGEVPEIEILFEVRAESLKRQPGEICFPGGSFEEKDGSFERTVVRETCEELGLTEKDVEVWGELDTFVANMGSVVHPFVGRLKNREGIRPATAEVSEVFTVPLGFFLDTPPEVREMELWDKAGDDFPFDLIPRGSAWRARKKYRIWFWRWENHVVWGMTASMLRSFLERFRGVLK
ncbi:MAG: CoA pyrophosphatase [Phascolarctobacterium sp.]|nr:CoA pyrophosphatase [Phascolarctobacterium sp.]